MQKRNRIILIILLFFLSLNFSLKRKYDFFKALNSYKKGEYKKALLLYTQYLKNGEKSSILNYNIATVYIKLKKYNLAEKYLKKSLKIAKEKDIKEKILFNLGYLMFLKGQRENALTLFKKSAIINPENIMCKKNIEILLNQPKRTKVSLKNNKRNKKKIKKEAFKLLNYIEDAERISIKNFLSKKEEKTSIGDKDW